MYDIERQLGEALNISRRNKVRNAVTDINVHLQQEARLRSFSNSANSNIRIERVEVAYWLEQTIPPGHVLAQQSQAYMQEEFTGTSTSR